MDTESIDISAAILKRYCPNGNRDIDAGMYKTSEILGSGTDLPICRKIFLQAIGKLGMTKDIDAEMLLKHLVITTEVDHFTKESFHRFLAYLLSIRAAADNGKGASDLSGGIVDSKRVKKQLGIRERFVKYAEQHPFVVLVLGCLCFWAFLSFLDRDKQLEQLESSLTNTTGSDYFIVSCADYFNDSDFVMIDQNKKDQICKDLSLVVDETNKQLISDFHTQPSEDGEVCSGRYDTDC